MYYPKSQITSNLYTNGEEFVNSVTNKPYVGYYYKVSNGKFYTGKTPNDLPTVELIKAPTEIENTSPIPQNSNILLSDNPGAFTFVDTNSITNAFTYLSLKDINIYDIPVKFNPYYSPQLPSQQDYQNGEFQRYFCKKTNEIIYIEIDEKQFTLLVNKDSQIEFSLYEPFTVAWQLVGNKQEVARVNKNIIELLMFRNKLPKFNLYLKEDYTKYLQ
jgi:hypothetical protein